MSFHLVLGLQALSVLYIYLSIVTQWDSTHLDKEIVIPCSNLINKYKEQRKYSTLMKRDYSLIVKPDK